MSNTVTVQLQLSFDAPILNPLLLLQNINSALVDAIETRGLAPAHHPDCPVDEAGDPQDASVTEYIELTAANHCFKTSIGANTTTTKIESQDLTGIDVTIPPAMKYLLVEINERNGEKEHTFKCLAQCSPEQNNDLVADAIALNWYEDDLDEHPFNRKYFWFEGWSIAVKVGSIYELPPAHYQVLRLYLSDLTPSNNAIAEAIAYKNAVRS